MQDPVDLKSAQAVHDREKQDLLWLHAGGGTWVIKDVELLRHLSELLRPVEDWSKKGETLKRQQEALIQQQRALSAAMEKVRANRPHFAEEDLRKLAEQLRGNQPNAEQLSKLQEQMAAMQERLAEAQRGEQVELSRKMSEIARGQEELARLQEAVGGEQENASEKAAQMLEKLLDDAVHSGLAKPCEPAH